VGSILDYNSFDAGILEMSFILVAFQTFTVES